MRELVATLFRPRGAARSDSAIGAELELIPVNAETRMRVGIGSTADQVGTAEVMREAARARAWTETLDAYGGPSWVLATGCRISYEPGGQIEISSPVCISPNELIDFLDDVVGLLRQVAASFGIALLSVGIDPYNTIERVPVQLHASRYEVMARHFNSIGTSGIRMMRQTASLQINLELGAQPFERWRLLNALAPYLTAAFANSRIYAGNDTGHASQRALLWQDLDSSRTGLPYDARFPIDAYATFAERAARILRADADHLTTLFPEVRPRGYFELRSIDSMDLDRVALALRFVSVLASNARATRDTLQLLGAPDPALLYVAATAGRADPELNSRIIQLEQIAGVATR